MTITKETLDGYKEVAESSAYSLELDPNEALELLRYINKLEEEVQSLHIAPSCVTTPYFWDCECEVDYIHPKTDVECLLCHVEVDEMPDSRITEVIDCLKDALANPKW